MKTQMIPWKSLQASIECLAISSCRQPQEVSWHHAHAAKRLRVVGELSNLPFAEASAQAVVSGLAEGSDTLPPLSPQLLEHASPVHIRSVHCRALFCLIDALVPSPFSRASFTSCSGASARSDSDLEQYQHFIPGDIITANLLDSQRS
eukprot:6213767-Pleurochrysis_carterae.AAC.4